MFEKIYAFISVIFVIWECNKLVNKRLLHFHLNNVKKNEYKKIERFMLSFYTVYLIIGLFVGGGVYLGAILVIKLIVEFLLNNRIKKSIKTLILRIDSLLAILLLLYYAYYMLCLV